MKTAEPAPTKQIVVMAGAWHLRPKRSRKSNHIDCFWTDVHTVGHDRQVSPADEPAADARPARVLVVGDANPDLVLSGDVVPRFGQAEQLLDEASLVVGGSATITAHGLARLGRPVSLVAAVGDDHFGCVPHQPSGRGGRRRPPRRGPDRAPDRTDRGAEPRRRPGHADPDRRPRLPDRVRAVRRAPTTCVTRVCATCTSARSSCCPSLATVLPAFLGRVRALGLTTSLDTNDDPAGRWQGVDALLPHLDVLLPNRDEVVALGRDPDPRRAAAALAARGPLTVVKDGAGRRVRRLAGRRVDRGGRPARRRRRHHGRRRHLRRRLPRRLARRPARAPTPSPEPSRRAHSASASSAGRPASRRATSSPTTSDDPAPQSGDGHDQ